MAGRVEGKVALNTGTGAERANQAEITFPGIHFVPEDSPGEIGHALAAWTPGLA
jgi:hypothetical protein